MDIELTRRWKSLRCWLCLVMCLGLLFIVDVFQVPYSDFVSRRLILDFQVSNSGRNHEVSPILSEEEQLKGFLVKTPGCRLLYMDPFDRSVRPFISTVAEKPAICNRGLPPLFESNSTSVFLLPESLVFYSSSNQTATSPISTGEIMCCYASFKRRRPRPLEKDSKITYNHPCIPITTAAQITDEFIRVTCTNTSGVVYQDFFAFVPLKNDSYTATPEAGDKMNVLIVGIDAVSRLNFHRQMPRTVDYLTKNLSAVELLGYNKVADNTFPNLIPVLTGLSEGELTSACWPTSKSRFDACHFIWKEFKRRGYLTALGEDSAWMGIFNYVKGGFYNQPTDYMWSVFNRAAERQIGNVQRLNVNECVGSRPVYRVLLSYIANFVTIMETADLPYFAFFWGSSLSHDILNRPSLGDQDYHDLFQRLHDSNFLNRTLLIVMSDHGIRWGKIRETYQGLMEERLPFLFLSMPEWYKRQHRNFHRNLVKNRRRLTTPFDLHETLKHLLDPSKYTGDNNRGYSLFNPISPSRTCEDAHIDGHWCTCQQSQEVAVDDPMVKRSTMFVVDFINDQLKGYAQCDRLSLSKIINARIMTGHKNMISKEFPRTRDYMVTFTTVPGDGMFEVTVRTTPPVVEENEPTYRFDLMGSISRLTLYGKESACILDFHLKLYCYCKSLVLL